MADSVGWRETVVYLTSSWFQSWLCKYSFCQKRDTCSAEEAQLQTHKAEVRRSALCGPSVCATVPPRPFKCVCDYLLQQREVLIQPNLNEL